MSGLLTPDIILTVLTLILLCLLVLITKPAVRPTCHICGVSKWNWYMQVEVDDKDDELRITYRCCNCNN